MAYLSDVIGDSYKEWEKGFVFLKAGTGCGKTTFVLNVLTQHAIKNGKRILYLVNRTILKQQLMSLLENPHLEAHHAELEANYQKYCQDEYDEKSFESIDRSIDNHYIRYTDYETHFPFLNLTLRTYQNFEEMILEGKTEYYDYIVCDEAHYFMNDSTFSDKTFVSYRYIMNKGKKKESTVILMSATAWYLEKRLLETGCLKSENIYYIPSNYDHVSKVNIYLFQQLDSVINRILTERPNSRILFFSNNPAVYKYFYENHNDISCFMAAPTSQTYIKYSDIMTHALIEKGENGKWTFNRDKKICITTSAMDNGVSIQDNSINFVFCDFEDICQTIQAIGRKRVDEDDWCYIYLQNQLQYSSMDKYFENCNVADMLYEKKYEKFNEYLISKDYFGSPLELFEKLPILYFTQCDITSGITKFMVKRPLYHQYQWLIQQNLEVQELMYVHYVKKYLPELENKIFAIFFERAKIESILKSYPDNKILKEQKANFLKKLRECEPSFDRKTVAGINSWLKRCDIKFFLTRERPSGHRGSDHWQIHENE